MQLLRIDNSLAVKMTSKKHFSLLLLIWNLYVPVIFTPVVYATDEVHLSNSQTATEAEQQYQVSNELNNLSLKDNKKGNDRSLDPGQDCRGEYICN